jgi:hypothetical protein
MPDWYDSVSHRVFDDFLGETRLQLLALKPGATANEWPHVVAAATRLLERAATDRVIFRRWKSIADANRSIPSQCITKPFPALEQLALERVFNTAVRLLYPDATEWRQKGIDELVAAVSEYLRSRGRGITTATATTLAPMSIDRGASNHEGGHVPDFIPDEGQLLILEVLERKTLKREALIHKVQRLAEARGSTVGVSKPRILARLRELMGHGRVRHDRRLGGYFRLDAPSPEVAARLSANVNRAQ